MVGFRINEANKGYFSTADSVNLVSSLRKYGENDLNDLEKRLTTLSADEREFIDIACKVARCGKFGQWTTQPSSSDEELILGRGSSLTIADRFTILKQKLERSPKQKDRSNFFVSFFKGLSNLFFRHSSGGLARKVMSLPIVYTEFPEDNF